MVEGTRNTPLPITVPITIEMALQSPSTRCSFGPEYVVGTVSGINFRGARLRDKKTDAITNQEGSRGPDKHVPGIRYVRAQQEGGQKSGGHAGNSSPFARLFRKDAE